MRSIPGLLVTSPAHPKSGPFPPPALPGFDGTTSLSVTPRRPGLSLAGVRLGYVPTAGASRVASISLCRHAVAITPVGPQAGSIRSPETCGNGLPRVFGGSAPTLVFSRPAQRSRMLRPAYSRHRLAALSIEGFDDFVTSVVAPIATGWSKSCRVGIAPTENRRLCTAHIDSRRLYPSLSLTSKLSGRGPLQRLR